MYENFDLCSSHSRLAHIIIRNQLLFVHYFCVLPYLRSRSQYQQTSSTTLKIKSKFHLKCSSSSYVNVIIQEDEVRRVDNGEELLLIVLNSNENDGTQVWYSEEEYIPPSTEEPTSNPSSSPTLQVDKNYELLEGTVLFAQSHIIPSKPDNMILNDKHPHLTALR